MAVIKQPVPQFSVADTRQFQHLAYGQKSVQGALKLAVQCKEHVRLVSVPGIDALASIRALYPPAAQELASRQYEFQNGYIRETQPVACVQQQPEILDCPLASFEQLFGKLHYHQEQWLFQPGLLFTAHEHFVVLRAEQLLVNPELSMALAASVRSGEIQWPQQLLQKSVTVQIAPTPLLCRFILLGSPLELLALEADWPDLNEQLPLLGEFSDRVSLGDAKEYPGFLQGIAHKVSGYELSKPSISLLMQLASRWAEHNQFLSLASQRLGQLIKEAATFVETPRSLEPNDILQAISFAEQRHNQLAQESYRDFADGTMKLQISGSAVGQVNGLTVVDVGSTSYGEPARITASVHYGDGDVIDIERKAELAGNIHAKGTLILAAYVAQIFAKDAPLHLSANIVFEQSYYEVDGDSASLAELVALLSALGRIPVFQDMAVTGAIDQFGNVQAIGGVNEKIEGFYEVSQLIEPGTKVSIVMPASNAHQLNLNAKCAKAVHDGLLTIHTVEHVSEALELLTGIPSGVDKEDTAKGYPKESVFGKVQRRLLSLADPIEAEPTFFGRFFDLFR